MKIWKFYWGTLFIYIYIYIYILNIDVDSDSFFLWCWGLCILKTLKMYFSPFPYLQFMIKHYMTDDTKLWNQKIGWNKGLVEFKQTS